MRGNTQVASSQDPTEIEVTSRLSELYPFIEEQHGSLGRALNNVDAEIEDDDDDELAVEDSMELL